MIRPLEVLVEYSGANCSPEAGELTRRYFAAVARQGVDIVMPLADLTLLETCEWLESLPEGELAHLDA